MEEQKRPAMPMRGELPIPAARFDDRTAIVALWAKLSAALNNSNFLAVFYFCAIGLLLTACLIRAFPDSAGFADVFEQMPF
jgi:hypothetical protein